MHKERKDKHFIKKPIYPGGLKAMRELIKKELEYPKEALNSKTEGTVYLRYEIDYKGNVKSSKILSKVGYGCDEEAQRLVNLFKFQIPNLPRKMKIKFHKTIKIHFRLPKIKEQKVHLKPYQPIQKQVLSYTIIPKKSIVNKEQNPQKGGYTYTIRY